MSRKVYVEVKVRLIIDLDDEPINEILENMDYNFSYEDGNCEYITDSEIIDWKIKDSK